MNVENIKLVRDHIAALPPERFGMAVFFGTRKNGYAEGSYDPGRTNAQQLEGSCGTCACIAGHAMALLDPDGYAGEFCEDGAKLLGLDSEIASALFDPGGFDPWFEAECRRMDDVTRSEAVAVLDHLLATGKVDWSVIGQEGSADSDSGEAVVAGSVPGGTDA